ncbi:MAG: hypothetical protein KYQ20_02385 [Candidatus Nealsonbacteria bacterium]|nr:hypothetical protein [Candidatus Nealsonbacteria bacterium]
MRAPATKKTNKIPSSFQGILWSVNVKNLDLEKDKIYIIHQVLEYGNLKEIAWLFKVYSKRDAKEVFEKMPMKIYSPQSFYFIKNIILDLKEKPFSSKKYVATLY